MNNLLIIQFRTDQSLPQEQTCFNETLKATAALNIRYVNAISENLDATILENIDHVMLGGSGEFFLGAGAGESTWLSKVYNLIDEIYRRNIPILGICFGHQILLKHAGAEIKNIPEMRETGTFLERLNDASRTDELFKHMPAQFDAILAHQETPIDLPPHVQVLGSSDRVEASVVRIGAHRAWGVMFHPDMNLSSVRERFAMFPHYAENAEKFVQALESFRDAPIAQNVIANFLRIK